ncbi:MAG TPA: hypothetical protein VIU61_19030 [Kofleriaceae bacterium]
MTIARVLLASLLFVPVRPAEACGVPDNFLSGVAAALESKSTPIREPVVVVGIGGSAGTVDGLTLIGRVGYGWGERTRGFIDGDSTTRILVGVRKAPELLAVGATYGWAGTGFGMSAALDVGVEADVRDSVELGPTASVTFGIAGVGAQLGATMQFGDTPRAVGSALFVIDISGLPR